MSKKNTNQAAIAETETQSLADFTEKAYLDYSMYVILDRALPFLGDGLKPVQRRIVYAMSELGLKATAKYKKSARTIGDVLGKFHPHGDTACYEAMVLMAQSFSYRYPLVDGQGNWGSADDPKSFAAMRYTESRLAPYAQLLLSETQQGTIDWAPNFDGTLQEPAYLPARLPNVLLNGGSGIAVGMSTDIPPHNLTEVSNACIYLLENPKATIEQVCEIIQGPDFCSQADIITSREEILAMYKQGNGSIRMRATFCQEKNEVVITALPHQVSGNKVLEQIAAQMQAKKLPNIIDLCDESDHENPTRIVLTLRSNRVEVEPLMAHLFATTDLEKSYRANFNMIGLNGKPAVKNLLVLLQEWLQFRMETVTKRLKTRLEQVLDRLHILAGLLIAYLNLDEIIRIIREEDEPQAKLIKKYKLSEQQAHAILEIKLRQLAKLEEHKIKAEEKELADERVELEKILGSKQRLKSLIKKEIKHDCDHYGDVRKSAIVARPQAQAMRVQDMLPAESITVILSKQGWIRAAKGHDVQVESLNYRAGDEFLAKAQGKSNASVVFLDSFGQSYAIAAHTLPSARGQGEPLTGRLKPQAGAHFVSVLMGDEKRYVLLASSYGYGFVTPFANLFSKNRGGKAMLKVPEKAQVLTPQWIEDLESQTVAAATSEGYLLLFPLADLPELARGKGNKIINIPSARLKSGQEYCIALAVLHEKSSLVVCSGRRQFTLKAKDLVHFQGERGRRGYKLPRGFQRVEKLVVE